MSDGPTLQISPITELFRGDRVALWATTYNVDLDLFNNYLLSRLGEPPLNVVVIADRDRLDSTLELLPPDRLASLGPVNRRWLLRGARLGTGRFHPKSYLAVTGRSVKLLVGSGNLSTSGLDAGREVFAVFAAGTPQGDAAIRTWMSWMRRVVSELDDTMLAERYSDLEERIPRIDSVSVVMESPLWHNLDLPLADQFCDRVLARGELVDELIVTAPYYDETGDALGRLLTRLKPQRLTVYTAASTKVDGTKLEARLAAADAEVRTFAYLPEAFTHAKLIGAVSRDHGWLMSGSANLSNAALSFRAGPAGTGNVELAVVADLPADELRRAFLPPDTQAEERPLTSLATLAFEPSPDASPVPLVHITRATSLPDGRVEITASPPPDDSLRLADHNDTRTLAIGSGRAVTTGVMAGPIVHLVDRANRRVSNHSIVEDTESLRRILQSGEKNSASGRPSELTTSDLDTPLGQALLYLQQNVVMDVSETVGSGGGSDTTRSETQESDTDDNLWDRLEREKLGQDPRAGAYARLIRAPASVELGEPLIELLDAMRERVPSEHSPEQTLLRRISGPIRLDNPASGTPWSTSARIRVRARNVLRRWASVQTDPRLTWVDPLAPLGNLALIAATFAQLWRYNAEPGFDAGLTEDDLDDLWLEWIRRFVGTGRGDGLLSNSVLTEGEIRSRLGGDFARNVTVLCWLAIRPGRNRRQRIVEWQPVLRGALDQGLVEVGDDTAEFLVASGFKVSADAVETDILEALEFIDDDLWCAQRSAELALAGLELKATTSAGDRTGIRIMVDGIDDPLHDPRIPALVVSISRYRRTDTVAIFGKNPDWRLAISGDEPIYYMASLHADGVESEHLEPNALDSLAGAAGVIADLFPASARSA